jgi:UDP-glucose 4-epimerase
MKCLVTGGAGFIGSHLVERLVLQGHEVKVVDDLSSGKLSNLDSVKEQIQFYQMDIASVEAESIFEGQDLVFHLAARADIVPSIVKPSEYMHANVVGTLRVLEAVRKYSINRLIYTASSSCYGLATEVPTSENAPIEPMYPYALSKWMAEEMVFHWTKLYKLNALSLRLFNVYGPRARTSGNYGAVLGVFFAQRFAGQPLTIVGDGTQSRDFVYVDDVVDAFILAGESKESGYAINIGAGNPIQVNKVAEIIGGGAINIPHRPGEPEITHADTELALQKLGWKPKTDFESGIKTAMSNLEIWKDAPVWTPDSIEVATEEWFKYLSIPKNKC